MQNKPNVKDAQINVNSYMKSKYEKLDNWLSGKNKANSNPIKPNFKKAKMNISYVKTTNYEQKTMNYVNNKQTQFPKWPKMNVNLTFTKDYRKNDVFATQKTNPIQTQCKAQLFITIGIIGQIIPKINK